MDNVCPHQGSLIISEAKEKLSCQFHSWAWNSQGKPLSAGVTSLCNSFELELADTTVANNLIFSGNISIPELDAFDLSNMTLVEERVDTVNTNYKNIMDVFLDVDHIPVVHRGVYPSIGIKGKTQVIWTYYDWGSLQVIERNVDYSDEYKSTLLNTQEEQTAAFWLAVYPYTMIEWQPGALIVTICCPKDNCTDITVLKYRDSRYKDDNWKLNSDIWEFAWSQDKYQATAIVEFCNFKPHLEESKIHFRNWLAQ
jgi:phenylpropionate dioxygenase-like ring-hydroxylating dioxygenase large terminal subunit